MLYFDILTFIGCLLYKIAVQYCGTFNRVWHYLYF